MSLFSSWFGKTTPEQQATEASTDAQEIARYRYMLKTAPPETIEQAHAEAFARLTPEQRNLVLRSLSESMPVAERAAVPNNASEPQPLARLATRAEIRHPGTIERMLGSTTGVGLGGLMAGSLLSSIAGTVIGSMIAHRFFANDDVARNETVSDAAAPNYVPIDPAADNYVMDDSSGSGGDSGGGLDA